MRGTCGIEGLFRRFLIRNRGSLVRSVPMQGKAGIGGRGVSSERSSCAPYGRLRGCWAADPAFHAGLFSSGPSGTFWRASLIETAAQAGDAFACVSTGSFSALVMSRGHQDDEGRRDGGAEGNLVRGFGGGVCGRARWLSSGAGGGLFLPAGEALVAGD